MIQALEMKAQIDEKGQIVIEKPLLANLHERVKIIILFEQEEEEFDDAKWLHSLAVNPAFDFLKEEAENIYTAEDGQPFTHN